MPSLSKTLNADSGRALPRSHRAKVHLMRCATICLRVCHTEVGPYTRYPRATPTSLSSPSCSPAAGTVRGLRQLRQPEHIAEDIREERFVPCSRGEVEPHDFCSGGETNYEMRLHSAMMLSGGGYDRRCIMAVSVQQIHPIAHLPLVLGVLRRLEVATVIDRLIPPHPAHGLSCGRGVDALVLAILDGQHALYKVGRRLEEQGMVALLQPDLTRASLNDYRLGHILDALFAANLNAVLSAVALHALEVYAIPTPWLHQDTTTIALYGAYADEPQTPGAPRPAYGHSKDGRDDLKQVLLSLGVSGAGGVPLRLEVRDGNRSDSVETPMAIEECLALGLEGVRGIVADSKAYSRRTLGLCLEHTIDLVTLVPRTCAVRQELEACARPQPALPLLVERQGRNNDVAPHRRQGQR